MNRSNSPQGEQTERWADDSHCNWRISRAHLQPRRGQLEFLHNTAVARAGKSGDGWRTATSAICT